MWSVQVGDVRQGVLPVARLYVVDTSTPRTSRTHIRPPTDHFNDRLLLLLPYYYYYNNCYCLPLVTELFQSLLLVSGTVCPNTSPPHHLWLSSGPGSKPIC